MNVRLGFYTLFLGPQSTHFFQHHSRIIQIGLPGCWVVWVWFALDSGPNQYWIHSSLTIREHSVDCFQCWQQQQHRRRRRLQNQTNFHHLAKIFHSLCTFRVSVHLEYLEPSARWLHSHHQAQAITKHQGQECPQECMDLMMMIVVVVV